MSDQADQLTQHSPSQRHLQPFYIVPLLVEQPTWGGEYIQNYKQLTNIKHAKNTDDQAPLKVGQLKIGQSYELAQESLVYTGTFQPCYQLGRSGKINALENNNIPKNAKPLSDFLNQTEYSQLPKPEWALIKFTQAQENSYQAHVTQTAEKTSSWKAKPESWYFFEEGYATLGLNPETCADPQAYKERCHEINQYAQMLSKQCRTKQLSVKEARAQLQTFIEKNHPKKYVNCVRIPQNSTVDLSQGGIHHSWEAHQDLPQGNIVYEVQKDVKDDVSTLRSFDQGKIKDDGTIRTLTINEYFNYLDTDPTRNQPAYSITQQECSQNTRLFDTPYYTLDQITFSKHTPYTSDSFSHIFVKEGAIEIRIENSNENKNWQVPQGWSIMLPPKQRYSIQTKESAIILVTQSP